VTTEQGHRAGLPAPIAWRRLADLPRAEGATALAVDPASARIAVGDAAGVLLVQADGHLARLLRRGPVRDLAFLPSGDLLAATEQGLYRIDPAGRRRRLALAPGAAGLPLRIAVAAGAVAVATQDGAFLSRDGERWRRIGGLPSGPVVAVALRSGLGWPGRASEARSEPQASEVVRASEARSEPQASEVVRASEARSEPQASEVLQGEARECLVLVRGELRAIELASEGGDLVPGAPRREELALAFREDPVDVVPGLAGADLALLFPTALALREAAGGSWRLVQPGLPPGALAHRIAEGIGRLWLATDRGLLEAADPGGPWRRAAEPAGSREVGALVAGAGSLHAAVGSALLAATPGRGTAPRGVLAELPVDPAIERVHRAALDFLDLGPQRIVEMRRGVRRRGWLPELALSAAAARDRGEGSGLDESFVSGALRQLADHDEERSDDNELSLTLTWEFADLAYHPEQIDISREAREIIELRDDVLDEITQLYFERRRVLAELAAAESPAEATRLRLRAAELAAGIDAWTGGWFSRALRERPP
jgi:hypothetical protein